MATCFLCLWWRTRHVGVWCEVPMVLRNISTSTSKTFHRCPPVPQRCHSAFTCSQTLCGLSLCPVRQRLIPSPSLMIEATQPAPDFPAPNWIRLKTKILWNQGCLLFSFGPIWNTKWIMPETVQSRFPWAHSDSCFLASQIWKEVSLLSCSPHGPWTWKSWVWWLGHTYFLFGFQYLSSVVVKAFPD